MWRFLALTILHLAIDIAEGFKLLIKLSSFRLFELWASLVLISSAILVSPLLASIFVEVVILVIIFLWLFPLFVALLTMVAESLFWVTILMCTFGRCLVVVIEAVWISLVILVACAWSCGSVIMLLSRLSSRIVFSFQALIRQDIVGGSDIFEFIFLCFGGLTFNGIRMVFLCQLVELFFDLSLGCVFFYAKLTVVVHIRVELFHCSKSTERLGIKWAF